MGGASARSVFVVKWDDSVATPRDYYFASREEASAFYEGVVRESPDRTGEMSRYVAWQRGCGARSWARPRAVELRPWMRVEDPGTLQPKEVALTLTPRFYCRALGCGERGLYRGAATADRGGVPDGENIYLCDRHAAKD